MAKWIIIIVFIFCGCVPWIIRAFQPIMEQRLHHFLLTERGYNKLVRPFGHKTVDGRLTVKLGLRLSAILDVSEKNQIITTNLWLRHEWLDNRLKWDPNEFDGINLTHIPSEDLWRPDVILYNNADGDFVITLLTKTTVYHTGLIVWEPPAIYKSYCPINVEFFPFDQQSCFMKFGCWTHNGDEVDLQHVWQDKGTFINENLTVILNAIDLCEYGQHVEWDIINVTASRRKKIYPCCPESYLDLTFFLTLRRRTLFYTINLILPCVAISALTVLVFYLPSDSGEKITLSISILLALTVFFLLLSDINPPTSIVIPLIGKYLLFTMIVVSMSIFLTVYTLSVRFRSPDTHTMSPWTRRVFTEILPRILCMERPGMNKRAPILTALQDADDTEIKEVNVQEPGSEERPSTPRPPPPSYENVRHRKPALLSREMRNRIKDVQFIAEHLKQGDDEILEEKDWNYVAMVMDRLFLVIFTTACVCGTVGIYLNAPSLYDPRKALSRQDFNCSR